MMKSTQQVLLHLASGSVLLALVAIATGGEPKAAKPANYARPFAPPTSPAFLPLPPGAVEPTGWLRDWCLAARDGYTGHMDEYDDEFKRAWAADHKMTGERLNWYKGAWPYEGGGYWFDGLSRLGYALHDEALIAQAKRRLYVVADNMNSARPPLSLVARSPASGRPRCDRMASLGMRAAGARHVGLLCRLA